MIPQALAFLVYLLQFVCPSMGRCSRVYIPSQAVQSVGDAELGICQGVQLLGCGQVQDRTEKSRAPAYYSLVLGGIESLGQQV